MFWTLLLVFALLIAMGVDWLSDFLSLKTLNPNVPSELKPYFSDQADSERKRTERLHYQKDCLKFNLKREITLGILTLAFIGFGGIGILDQSLLPHVPHPIARGLVFFGLLGVFRILVTLPFQYAFTYGIETRYGFNKTSQKTFFIDRVKGLFLSVLIGAPVLGMVFYLFQKFSSSAWFYAWLFLTLMQLLFGALAPVLILPLFNRFEPIDEAIQPELKEKLFSYAKKVQFGLGGIYKMDGSKRSSKANAFFTGFGKLRKLVLFDTLIDKLTPDEILAVFAHEVGHSKEKHILKALVMSSAVSFGLFYLFSWLMKQPELYFAFGIHHEPAPYLGLLCAMIVIDPGMKVFSIFTHALSRKHEFEADQYSIRTAQLPEAMIYSLAKLSEDHFSNLMPHRLKVLLEYTHPPLLERARAIQATKISQTSN